MERGYRNLAKDVYLVEVDQVCGSRRAHQTLCNRSKDRLCNRSEDRLCKYSEGRLCNRSDGRLCNGNGRVRQVIHLVLSSLEEA
jgi:hypothetical protein